MFIAENFVQFKSLFVHQLKNMLTDDELGAFILVLANSYQDAFLKSALEDDLKNNFAVLKNKFSAGSLKATQDDLDVFEKLLKVELEGIPVWQYKTVGDWEIVYNAIRRMRPARASAQVLDSIIKPYDETRFHFNKPFLKPEILWQGIFGGVTTRVLFNKFPFSSYHLLIVVSPEKNKSQLLTQKTHQYAFSLLDEMAQVFPGLGLGYNSLAAGASVNHLHFQGFIREQLFPIEKKCWRHNSGDIDYPLPVRRFSDVESSWHFINHLSENNEAFNCLYRNGACYVIPRKYQGVVKMPDWLTGAGWIDMAGAITVSDEDTFNSIDAQSVEKSLGLLKN